MVRDNDKYPGAWGWEVILLEIFANASLSAFVIGGIAPSAFCAKEIPNKDRASPRE